MCAALSAAGMGKINFSLAANRSVCVKMDELMLLFLWVPGNKYENPPILLQRAAVSEIAAGFYYNTNTTTDCRGRANCSFLSFHSGLFFD
jgi:hypothetical protein